MTMDSITIIRDHLIFRILLKAMSRPGRVYPLPDCPPGLPAAACLLNCLLDNETSLAVIGDSELDTFLPRHFGCLSALPKRPISSSSAGELRAVARTWPCAAAAWNFQTGEQPSSTWSTS